MQGPLVRMATQGLTAKVSKSRSFKELVHSGPKRTFFQNAVQVHRRCLNTFRTLQVAPIRKQVHPPAYCLFIFRIFTECASCTTAPGHVGGMIFFFFFWKGQSLLLGLRAHHLQMHANASQFRGSFCMPVCLFSYQSFWEWLHECDLKEGFCSQGFHNLT